MTFSRIPCALAALTLAATAPVAMAQSTTGMSMGGDGWSMLPYTQRGYVGLNLGKPKYDLGCPVGLACDDPSTMVKVYTGGMVNEWLGAEVGYLHMGSADRAGGTTRAQGLNLSFVGRVPLGAVSLFGKVGTTYGRTKVSADIGSGVVTGKDSGWNTSYGVGAGFELSRNSSIVLEWERHGFDFAGVGRQHVKATSLGYVHRF